MNTINILKREIAQLDGKWESIRTVHELAVPIEEFDKTIIHCRELAVLANQTELSELLLDIEVYLSGFVEKTIVPNALHLKQLNTIIKPIFSIKINDKQTINIESNKRSPQPRSIYYLHAPSRINVPLTHILAEHRFAVRPFMAVDDLIQELKHKIPDTLVVDAHYIGDLSCIIQHANNNLTANTARASIIVVSRNRRINARLLALRNGADEFFGPDDRCKEVAKRICELTYGTDSNPYHVVVIDDDQTQTQLIELILKSAGIKSTVFNDSQNALDKIDQLSVDLIITDLYMPGIDGMELTALIRQKNAYKNLPIIVLSGEESESIRFSALAVGADDFFTKPIRPRHLISAVNGRIRRSRQLLESLLNDSEGVSVSGLSSRKHFLKKLSELHVDNSTSNDGLLHIEVDNIEKLRFQLGINGTDELLEELAQLIFSRVQHSGLVCKYGFCSLLATLSHALSKHISDVTRELCQLVSQHVFLIDQTSCSVTISIGLCHMRDHPSSAKILSTAEQACLDALRAGGNQVEESYIRKGSDYDESEKHLIELINRKQLGQTFVSFYQPIVCVHASKTPVYRLTLLLRNPGSKPIRRYDYEKVILREGLEADLDQLNINFAIQQLAVENDISPQLFIPLSSTGLTQGNLIRDMLNQMRKNKLSTNQIIIEFSMDDLRSQIKRAMDWLPRCKRAGIRTCMSRINGDRNSIQALTLIDTDFIRLTPELLYENKKGNEERLQTVLRHAKSLGRQIVLPGLNQANRVARYWNLGADFMEGDIIGEPRRFMDFDFTAAIG